MKLMDWNRTSTVILRNQVFYCGMSLFSLFYELLFHQYRHKYTSNEVKLFFPDRDIVTGMKYINSLFDQNYIYIYFFIYYRI